jgi:phosphopantothenoylcysteine decarboxylase/phosphopantothenate--cysteine ligase
MLPLYGSLVADLELDVVTVMTPDAARMIAPGAVRAVTRGSTLVDWHADASDRFPTPHVDLPRWCDAFVVVPASARTFAAVAAGDAANLLQLAILNHDAPVGFVPVMNDVMWTRPAVQRNVATVRADGHEVLAPGEMAHLGRSASSGGGLAFSPGQVRAFVRGMLKGSMGAGPEPARAVPAT